MEESKEKMKRGGEAPAPEKKMMEAQKRKQDPLTNDWIYNGEKRNLEREKNVSVRGRKTRATSNQSTKTNWRGGKTPEKKSRRGGFRSRGEKSLRNAFFFTPQDTMDLLMWEGGGWGSVPGKGRGKAETVSNLKKDEGQRKYLKLAASGPVKVHKKKSKSCQGARKTLYRMKRKRKSSQDPTAQTSSTNYDVEERESGGKRKCLEETPILSTRRGKRGFGASQQNKEEKELFTSCLEKKERS